MPSPREGGGGDPCQQILPQSHWSHTWRRRARRGSYVTQYTPGWVGYGRSAAIHFLAGVGVSVPPKEMLEGKVEVKSGGCRVVASLASRSTSLFRRMVVAGKPAHRDRLALYDLGGHLSEINV